MFLSVHRTTNEERGDCIFFEVMKARSEREGVVGRCTSKRSRECVRKVRRMKKGKTQGGWLVGGEGWTKPGKTLCACVVKGKNNRAEEELGRRGFLGSTRRWGGLVLCGCKRWGLNADVFVHAQTLSMLSQLPVQSAIPSDETPRQLTRFSWPARTPTRSPFSVSQTLQLKSS